MLLNSDVVPQLTEERLLAPKEVVRRTSLSRTTLWRLAQIGAFPKSVRISPGRCGWRAADVEQWIASRLNASLREVA
jgi:prophage regulatory protein